MPNMNQCTIKIYVNHELNMEFFSSFFVSLVKQLTAFRTPLPIFW